MVSIHLNNIKLEVINVAMNYRFYPTLEENIKGTILVNDTNAKTNLYFGKHKLLELTPDRSSVHEHLGYFHELSKHLKLPYQKCLDAFEVHYRKLLKTVKVPKK